ncbi:unnamed protein product [Prunus brigantina]
MAKRFKSLSTLMLDSKYLHMRCVCYILNLVVKNRLKELFSSIEGIRNCVKYIYSSPSMLDKFRDFAILESMDMMANIPLDVATRWNATYKMLDDAFKGVGSLGPLQTLDEGDEYGLKMSLMVMMLILKC